MESFLGVKESFKKHKRLLIYLTAGLFIFLITIIGFTQLQKNITVFYDEKEVQISTLASTVGAVLAKAGVQVSENDKVVPGLDAVLEDNLQIVVHRAFEVNLTDNNKEKTVLTAEKTVENALRNLNIKLNEFDRVEPEITSPLKAGDTIKITRVTKKTASELTEIPFKLVTKHNGSMDYGKTKMIQEGKNGLKEVTWETTYENGKEVSRTVLSEKIQKEPVDEIIEKGTVKILVTSRGETRRYKRSINMLASAYDAGYESTGKTPDHPHFGITRSGTRVRPGVVAVDPRVIPLGSKLYIESASGKKSYGYASAEDTGGAIRGNRIDIYFECRNEALRFGKRNVKVYVLE